MEISYRGSCAVHFLYGFASKNSTNEECHHQGQGPEVDGPQPTNEEAEYESDYTDNVDGQGGLTIYEKEGFMYALEQ